MRELVQIRRVSSLLLAGALSVSVAKGGERVVGAFSKESADGGLPSGWRVAAVPKIDSTRFRLVEVDGETVVQLDAANAAASLYRPVQIDPAKTPVLRWSWRVRNLVAGTDLHKKSGDDLPARLYVMFDYPLDRLSLIERGKVLLARSVAGDLVPAAALCYVWDGKLPAGSRLWNAYTDRVRMLVAESGSGRLGQWVREQRNIAEDFRAAFGEYPPLVSGIAIAADTDQTGETVRSWFGDIRFSRH
jgi:hypothetical protein